MSQFFRQDLASATWNFRQSAPQSSPWRSAVVPGCVHLDLIRNHVIPDPFYGRNELNLQWIEDADWEYTCEFTPAANVWSHERVELVFEGLDTVVTVKLNGQVILQSENMFHRHRVDVKSLLGRGSNKLEFHFGSAMNYVRTQRQDFSVPREFNDPVGNSARIRKQQCQFGWDWGPRFVTAGLWRPAHLEAWSINRLESVRITQTHRDGAVELQLTPELANPSSQGELRGQVKFAGAVVATIAQGKATVTNPKLWWPAGHGDQPIYEIDSQWVEQGREVSIWQGRIGLRTIELDLSPDEFDVALSETRKLNRFGLRVNGRLIFAKGANWIPAHAFVNQVGVHDYLRLIGDAADANMNMLRVWGGGIYEDDCFYDLCDQLGLLVWQDFMFACTLYPGDDAFVASVRREAQDHVRRIRHHACIALWCGNNEIAMLDKWAEGGMKTSEAHRQAYDRLFLKTLPQVTAQLDPQRPYIHSSPALPIEGLPDATIPSQDDHEWNVWHARKPVDHYLTTRHRFVSEFGMQSYPTPEVAATFCPESELNVFSPTFDNHQKNVGGNQVILDYVSRLYRFPKDYRALAYLSQLNQAHCMKVAVEHYRRISPLCLGTLYWQINDCWPVASWSSIEFPGVWKALHHEAKRFFAPTIVSMKYLGTETRRIGNYVKHDLGAVELHAVHEGAAAKNVTLQWSLRTLDGKELAQGSDKCTLQPGRGALLQTIDLAKPVTDAGRTRVYLRGLLRDEAGQVISSDTFLFAPPRDLELRREMITTQWQRTGADRAVVTVASSTFHHRVWLALENTGVHWSDNYFDLYPNEPMRIEAKFPGAISDDTLARLKVMSLVDSYV